MIAPFTVWFDDSRGRGYELAGAVAERADAVDMMRRLPRAVVLFGSRVIAQRDGADVDAAIDAAKAFIEAPRYPLSAVAEAPVEAPADPAEEHAVVEFTAIRHAVAEVPEERPTVPVAGDHEIPATLPAAPMRPAPMMPTVLRCSRLPTKSVGSQPS